MKWLAIKFINFGVWIYDVNRDEIWGAQDQKIYEKLNKFKRELEKN